MTARKKRALCAYCQQGGIDAGMADLGYRRTIPTDAESKRVWANVRKYRCEICDSPGEYPKNPKPLIKR